MGSGGVIAGLKGIALMLQTGAKLRNLRRNVTDFHECPFYPEIPLHRSQVRPCAYGVCVLGWNARGGTKAIL